MKNNKIIFLKIFTFFLIFIISTGSIIFIPGINLVAQSLEDELEQVKKEREEINKKIEEVRKEEQGYIKQVNEVESQLVSSLGELNELNDKLAEAKSYIDKITIDLVLKEQELKKIEDELSEKVKILNRRVASIYKNGNENILEILLKAEDFIEFISRLKLMNLLAHQDAEIIKEIKDKRAANLNIKKGILDLREMQRDRKEEIARLVSQAEKKQREIEDIYNEKSSLLSKTRANKNDLLTMEKDFEIKEAEITRILESYKYGNAPGDKFMWPVAGRIKSGFGYRIHPIFGYRRFHSGIDLVAPNGTLVKAGDGGEVIQAGYDHGYGYSVVIYHGGGFATWYGHLSRILVSAGQVVGRGQVIGLVGATGWATGSHLHFEVRINGAAQNPLEWLQ
ncbi:MAG: hypothetical protein FJW69_05840 [Actinobacteria bacterium]|nr:hypothetical protein [Actinomycetota bacterium]MBM3712797.1 hypothetical protein [Actinomycetota bacterium]